MKQKRLIFLFLFLIFTSTACRIFASTQTNEENMITNNEILPPIEELKPTATGTLEPVLESDCQDLNDNENQVAISVADSYEVTYEQIIEWFCDGYSFENVLVALETSTLVDYSTDELLEMTNENNWDEIWKRIGYIR